jgi:hypothetical protein
MKRFVKAGIGVALLVLLVLGFTGCAPATSNALVGTWKDSVLGIVTLDFGNDWSFSRSTFFFLTVTETGTYSLDEAAGTLVIEITNPSTSTENYTYSLSSNGNELTLTDSGSSSLMYIKQ